MKERTTCGTIRPTKTIGPHAAVAAPLSIVATSMDSARVRLRSAPSALAVSSPMAMAFSGRASSSASRLPTTRNGTTCMTASSLPEASEPTVQKRIRPRAASSRIITAWR
ncbi:hypothetical protein GCM10019016_136730 [Streptomyces prasinosporus]|uniref:Uncharacterized protein n=1 Tax=Streptomyces prasinosporus TaxID=68256 RepID=A0ABP6UII0_9ACTN